MMVFCLAWSYPFSHKHVKTLKKNYAHNNIIYEKKKWISFEKKNSLYHNHGHSLNGIKI